MTTLFRLLEIEGSVLFSGTLHHKNGCIEQIFLKNRMYFKICIENLYPSLKFTQVKNSYSVANSTKYTNYKVAVLSFTAKAGLLTLAFKKMSLFATLSLSRRSMAYFARKLLHKSCFTIKVKTLQIILMRFLVANFASSMYRLSGGFRGASGGKLPPSQ